MVALHILAHNTAESRANLPSDKVVDTPHFKGSIQKIVYYTEYSIVQLYQL